MHGKLFHYKTILTFSRRNHNKNVDINIGHTPRLWNNVSNMHISIHGEEMKNGILIILKQLYESSRNKTDYNNTKVVDYKHYR